jgi:hypothetical protein
VKRYKLTAIIIIPTTIGTTTATTFTIHTGNYNLYPSDTIVQIELTIAGRLQSLARYQLYQTDLHSYHILFIIISLSYI